MKIQTEKQDPSRNSTEKYTMMNASNLFLCQFGMAFIWCVKNNEFRLPRHNIGLEEMGAVFLEVVGGNTRLGDVDWEVERVYKK